MLIVLDIKAKAPTTAKLTARLLRPPLLIMNRLTASTGYDVGFAFAAACSKLGIKFIGKNALLANIKGMVTRWRKARAMTDAKFSADSPLNALTKSRGGLLSPLTS